MLIGERLADVLRGDGPTPEPSSPLTRLTCSNSARELRRTRLAEWQAAVRAELPDWYGGEAASFLDPTPEFHPVAEGRVLDLLLLRGGPGLLLTYQAEAQGHLRRAYSHSGLLLTELDPGADWLHREPVVTDDNLLETLRYVPLADTAADLPAAREIVERFQELAGPELEVVRLHGTPAPLLTDEQWSARTAERSAAEEAPLLDLLLALLRAAGGDTPEWAGLRVHDPACHHGEALFRLGQAFPGWDLTYADQDPRWPTRTAARLAAAGVHARPTPVGSAEEQPGLPPASLDLLLLRAANRGVMTYAAAEASLAQSVRNLKPGGLLVLYGYTWPLLNQAHFRKQGLESLCASLRLEPTPLHTRGVVPFHVLRRPVT